MLESLKKIKSDLESLSHRKKSDSGYNEARKIATELRSLSPDSKNFRLDAQILDKYSMRGSDKSKEQVINEFKSETIYDVQSWIGSLERSSNPLIEE